MAITDSRSSDLLSEPNVDGKEPVNLPSRPNNLARIKKIQRWPYENAGNLRQQILMYHDYPFLDILKEPLSNQLKMLKLG